MNFISEWFQKLSLPKFLAYTTTIISATWVVATRVSDSKADYVNMRYDEIRNLQEQFSQLQAENEKLRAKLKMEPVKHSLDLSSPLMALKEFDKEGITFIEPISNIMITTLNINQSNNSVYLQFNFPDGDIYRQTFYVGSNYIFKINEKKYQIFTTEFADKKMKYFVRELPQ